MFKECVILAQAVIVSTHTDTYTRNKQSKLFLLLLPGSLTGLTFVKKSSSAFTQMNVQTNVLVEQAFPFEC